MPAIAQTTFTYPSNFGLKQIDQDYIAEQSLDDPIFDLFPIVEEDTWVLRWRQLDNFKGLQQARGLNGEPAKIKSVGAKEWEMEPSVYGEFDFIPEDQLMKRSKLSSINEPVDITDLVTEKTYHLTVREFSRLKKNLWDLLQTGVLSVYGPNGALIGQDAYTFQQYTPGTPWTTFATATPLADFRAAIAAAQPGHSVNFGMGANAWMSRLTLNNLFANTNANDFGGKKDRYGSNFLDLDQMNVILMANDLPKIAIYERGYYDDAGTFSRFMTSGKIVIVGERPGNQMVGEYVMTRNPGDPNFAPGPYLLVSDSLDTDHPVPRRIKIDKGHAGGPRLFYPSAVLIINAY